MRQLKIFNINGKKRKIKQIAILSILLITSIIVIANLVVHYVRNLNYTSSIGEFSNSNVILAIKIDGKISTAFPNKESGYVGTVACDNGATGVWNDTNWNIKISNLAVSKTTCNVEFVTDLCSSGQCLKNLVLAQFGGADAIIEADNSIFANPSSASEAVMYKTEDNYGTSYYYRGERDLLNNNLIFAEHQWKIVRINGDSSIRIIYNGKCPENNCEINGAVGDTTLESAVWNTTYKDDAKYVGYMYGGSNGDASTSKEQAQKNETSSNAKIIIDAWYEASLKDTDYEKYIEDSLFCDDRSITSGEGYGTNDTVYAAYTRLNINELPTLKCAQKNDAFTVKETTISNGALTYPVGLLSPDEVAMAGGNFALISTKFYLYVARHWWLMGASQFSGTDATKFYVFNNGTLYANSVSSSYRLRPVININAKVLVTGSGSAADPYIVI